MQPQQPTVSPPSGPFLQSHPLLRQVLQVAVTIGLPILEDFLIKYLASKGIRLPAIPQGGANETNPTDSGGVPSK